MHSGLNGAPLWLPYGLQNWLNCRGVRVRHPTVLSPQQKLYAREGDGERLCDGDILLDAAYKVMCRCCDTSQ